MARSGHTVELKYYDENGSHYVTLRCAAEDLTVINGARAFNIANIKHNIGNDIMQPFSLKPIESNSE